MVERPPIFFFLASLLSTLKQEKEEKENSFIRDRWLRSVGLLHLSIRDLTQTITGDSGSFLIESRHLCWTSKDAFLLLLLLHSLWAAPFFNYKKTKKKKKKKKRDSKDIVPQWANTTCWKDSIGRSLLPWIFSLLLKTFLRLEQCPCLWNIHIKKRIFYFFLFWKSSDGRQQMTRITFDLFALSFFLFQLVPTSSNLFQLLPVVSLVINDRGKNISKSRDEIAWPVEPDIKH